MIAARFGHLETIKFLVERGASVDAADNVKKHPPPVLHFIFTHIIVGSDTSDMGIH